MKKRLKIKQPIPFYSTEPAVPRQKIASRPLVQNASLGNDVPGDVEKKPARAQGIAGFSTHQGKPATKKAHGFGYKAPAMQGSLRLSGHSGAHKIGMPKLKLKI